MITSISPKLLERKNLITEIDIKLQGTNPVQILALIGVAGSGKTTLARAYVSTQKSNIIYEINAETPDTIISSFEHLAQMLAANDIDKKELRWIEQIQNVQMRHNQTINFVKDKLQHQNNWILIYDNVTTMQNCIKYLMQDLEAPSSIGRIIITTRDDNISHNSYIHAVVHIGELDLTQKQELFFKILHHNSKNPQQKNADKLLTIIPSFPLDISIAAKYIATTNISFEQYLEYLNDNTEYFNIMQQSILHAEGHYAQTRYAIMAKSLDQILSINPDFESLLLLISLLDSQNIPRHLLETLQDPVTVDNFLYNLKKYSFITNETDSVLGYSFSIHRSTQVNTLSHLMQKLDLVQHPQLLEAIIMSFGKHIDNAVAQGNLPIMQFLFTHCNALLYGAEDSNHELLSEGMRGYLEGKLGIIYYYLSCNAEAKNMLQKSIAKLEKGYDLYYADIAKNLLYLSLSTLYTEHDNGVTAQKLLNKSLDIYKKHSSIANPEMAEVLVHLGSIETKHYNFAQAKILIEQGLAIYKTDATKYHSNIAWALRYLGNMYRESGDDKNAQKYLTASLRMYNQGSNIHSDAKICTLYISLGQVYCDLGDYSKSQQFLEKAVDFTNTYYGERRPWALVHLATVYDKIGEYKKALSLFEKSTNFYNKYFVAEHLSVIKNNALYGNLYNHLGHYAKALSLLRPNFEIQQKKFGVDNIDTAWVALHLGSLYTNLSEYSKAHELLEQGLSAYSKYFDKQHIKIGWILSLLGKNHMLAGDYIKAQELLGCSLVIHEAHFGKDHFETARIVADLGNNELINGNLKDAETLLNRSFTIFKNIHHPDIYIILEYLADLNMQKSLIEMSQGNVKESKLFKNVAIINLKKAVDIINTHIPNADSSAHMMRINAKLNDI